MDPAFHPCNAARLLRFGPFLLEPAQRRLSRDGEPVTLGARAFDVLCALASRPGELLSKDWLLATVWKDLVVEEANLHVQISQLRKVVGSDAVATLPGQGYRFVWPVVSSVAAPPPTRRWSVIVLPFHEPQATPEQAYFADAITDDITAQLSKIRSSFVIAAATAFSYGRDVRDFSAVAAELGVRYALQGSIRREDDEIELSARLSDACTGAVIWSDRVALPAGRHASVRRELVARLATALNLQLLHAEATRSAGATATAPDSADLVMRARHVGGWNWSRQDYERARLLYDEALRLDPHNAEALARRAGLLANLANAWPGPEIDEQIGQAEADAEQALRLDSLDPLPHLALSHVRQQQYRLEEAAAHADSALELDPNAVMALQWRAELHRYAAESERGFEPLRRALELSPRDPHRWMFFARMGWLHVQLNEPEPARPWLERSLALHPHWTTSMALAIVHAQRGELDAARAHLPALATPEAQVHRRWNRVSRHPRFLSETRRHVFDPLLRCGALPGPGAIDDWEARQQRGGRPH